MEKFPDDDRGQLILIACVSIALALVLIAIYEYSTLGTGEKSINRENMNSYYYYNSIRDRYSEIYNNYTYRDSIAIFEKDLKEFALIHGYNAAFECIDGDTKLIFIDTDIKIEEELKGGLKCH